MQAVRVDTGFARNLQWCLQCQTQCGSVSSRLNGPTLGACVLRPSGFQGTSKMPEALLVCAGWEGRQVICMGVLQRIQNRGRRMAMGTELEHTLPCSTSSMDPHIHTHRKKSPSPEACLFTAASMVTQGSAWGLVQCTQGRGTAHGCLQMYAVPHGNGYRLCACIDMQHLCMGPGIHTQRKPSSHYFLRYVCSVQA